MVRDETLTMNETILFLRDRFPHMGQHSGYDRLCEALMPLLSGKVYSAVRGVRDFLPPAARSLFLALLLGKGGVSPYYNLRGLSLELRALLRVVTSRCALVHMMYVENDFGLFHFWRGRLAAKVVGTVHQPPSWWRLRYPDPRRVASFDGLIVLARPQIPFFEPFLPGRVRFIPHGVDTAFFRPPSNALETVKRAGEVRCVFSGAHLRDFRLMAEVVEKTLARDRSIVFDMVVPASGRSETDVLRMARHDRVCWHSGVSDEGLRALYQNGSMLVLPLIDGTANNAILEAMACGLPIISTNLPPLRDYTDDSFAILLPPGEAEGMVEAILTLAADPDVQRKRGQAARAFAESHLAWSEIALKTRVFYQEILSA